MVRQSRTVLLGLAGSYSLKWFKYFRSESGVEKGVGRQIGYELCHTLSNNEPLITLHLPLINPTNYYEILHNTTYPNTDTGQGHLQIRLQLGSNVLYSFLG